MVTLRRKRATPDTHQEQRQLVLSNGLKANGKLLMTETALVKQRYKVHVLEESIGLIFIPLD